MGLNLILQYSSIVHLNTFKNKIEFEDNILIKTSTLGIKSSNKNSWGKVLKFYNIKVIKLNEDGNL